ncbi:hypothetical protein CCP3SC5AM1_2830001 [Gammaproteobacteria bacterium]
MARGAIKRLEKRGIGINLVLGALDNFKCDKIAKDGGYHFGFFVKWLTKYAPKTSVQSTAIDRTAELMAEDRKKAAEAVPMDGERMKATIERLKGGGT